MRALAPVVALLVALAVPCPARAASPPACPMDLIPGGFTDPFTFAIYPQKAIQYRAVKGSEAIGDWRGLPAKKPAELGEGETSWEVHVDDTNEACRIDIKDYPPPNPIQLGVDGRKLIVPEMAAALFPDHPASADRMYPFLLASADALGAGKVGRCPRGKRLDWKPTENLRLPEDWRSPEALLAILGGDPGLCAKVADILGDGRRVVVRVGKLKSVVPLASLAMLDTPIFAEKGDTCSTAIETGPAERCRQFLEIPGAAIGAGPKVLPRKVEHFRRHVTIKVFPRLPNIGSACPWDPELVPVTDVSLNGAAVACVYADGHPLTRASGPAGLSRYRFVPCLVQGNKCVPLPSPPDGGAWPIESTGPEARIGLSVSGDEGSNEIVKTIDVKNYEVSERASERRFARPEDGFLCVPPLPDPVLSPLLSATVESGGQTYPVDGFVATGDGLCLPREWSLLGQVSLPDEYKVTFRVGASVYLQRTIVSNNGLNITGMEIRRKEELVESFGVTRRFVAKSSEWLFRGAQLCIRVTDQAILNPPPSNDGDLTELPVPLKRLWLKANGTTLPISLGASMRRAVVDPQGVLYCAPLGDMHTFGALVGIVLEFKVAPCKGECLPNSSTSGYVRDLREEAFFHSFQLGTALEAVISPSPSGPARVGGGVSVSIFDLGWRLTPQWTIALDAGLSIFWTTGPLGRGSVFDSSEAQNPPGTCVAGCGNVEHIDSSILGSVFAGPKLMLRPVRSFPAFSVELGAAPALQLIVDTRAGSGAYTTPSGRVALVGQRGDTNTHLDAGLQITLGPRVDYLGW